jgi:phosphorylcholine metabolism protein LicD
MSHWDNLRVSAKHIVETLNKHNIFYWLDYGTLLGVVRDGDIIKGDNDIDISVQAAHWGKVQNIDFGENYKHIAYRGNGNWDKVYRYEDGKQVTSCDLFYWHEDSGMLYRKQYVYKHEQGSKIDYSKHLFKLDKINMWGIDVNIPSNVDEFLQMRYGDWGTPV